MMLYSVFTRHLTCYTWCMIYGTGTWYIIFDTWSTALNMLYLIPDSRHLILDSGTWYMSYLSPDPDPQYMTHVTLTWYAFMWYKYIDLTSWPLTGHYHPWYLYYMAYSWLSLYGDLAWLLYYYQTFDTPELLYTWTTEIGRLLKLLMILTHVDPRNRITMDIGLLRIPCGLYYLTLCYI